METLKQFARLRADVALDLRTPGSTRVTKLRAGEVVVVTSPKYANKEEVLLDREKGASANSGKKIGMNAVRAYFTLLG